MEPDRGPAEHGDEAEADPQHHVDLDAARQHERDLHERGDHHHHGGQQHRRFADTDDTTRDQEAEVVRRERGGPVLVRVGVFEGAEEQDDRQEVEQQFHFGAKCIAAELMQKRSVVAWRATL